MQVTIAASRFSELSKEAKSLAALASIIMGPVSKTDLEHIAKTSRNIDAIKHFTAISSSAIQAAVASNFIEYKNNKIYRGVLPEQEHFFSVLDYELFKDLCLGYCRFLYQHHSVYLWSWHHSQKYKTFALRLQLYVFSQTEINKDKALKSTFSEYPFDSHSSNMSAQLKKELYLDNLQLEQVFLIREVKIRMRLIEHLVLESWRKLSCDAVLIDYLLERMHQIQRPYIAVVLAQILLFKKDESGLKKMIEDAPNSYYKTWAQGHLFFLQKDYKQALVCLEEGQTLFKRKQRSNKNDYNEVQILIAACLLALNAPASRWKSYWKSMYSSSYKDDLNASFLQVISKEASNDTLLMVENSSIFSLFKELNSYNAVYNAFFAYWANRKDLSKYIMEQHQQHDFELFREEFYQLQQHIKTGFFHEENDSLFLELYQPPLAWERFLDQIEQFTGQHNSASPVEKEERVVWLLDFENFDLQPKLQKSRKNNQWTKGRNIPIDKLFGQEYQNQLSPQDFRIIEAMKNCPVPELWNSKDKSHYQNFQVFKALCGHPYLFLLKSPDTACQIIEHKFELQLHKSTKGYFFYSNALDAELTLDYAIKRETASRYTFIPLTQAEAHILQLLNQQATLIPLEAEGRLQNSIDALSNYVTIHSELNIGQDVKFEIAENQLFVHILPLGDCFQIEFFTKPFNEHPPFCKPGEGLERILTEINGQQKAIQRDLEAEKRLLEDIIDQSTFLQENPQHSGIWTMEGIESCLKLLKELNPFRVAGTLIIEWPQGEKLRISAYASSDHLFMNLRTNNNWFEIEGNLRIDEHRVIEIQELLEKAAATRNNFIQLDDGSYLALTETLHQRLQEIERWTKVQDGKIQIPQLAGFALQAWQDELGIQGDEEWTTFLERMEEAQNMEFEVPKSLRATLRPYQLEGFQWLSRMAYWGAGACLADDMGLGKTVQAIAMLLQRAELGPALVVAPASVCSNWMKELERFAPDLEVYNLSFEADRVKRIEDLSANQVLVVTYGLLYQYADLLSQQSFGSIVLDEAQSIKNRMSKRSKAAMQLQGQFKLITTGTPVENHLGELWNLFQFINPGLLGDVRSFQERYALPIEKFEDKQVRDQLRQLISPFILRRHKTEVLDDLPPKTEINLVVERSAEEIAFYEALRRNALEEVQGQRFDHEGQRQMMVLAALMRLRRACCHPSMVKGAENIGSSKLDALENLVDELLENNHKALIFSQFVDHLRIIEKMIQSKNIAYQYLDGQTPLKKRQIAVDDFQNGKGDLFLISLKAGGTGLNLTEADYVIHVDPWWNPAVEDQASDRAHRIGQQKPVTVYRLIAGNSIEEKIVQLHEHKRNMAEALLEGNQSSSKLSAEDLLKLLEN